MRWLYKIMELRAIIHASVILFSVNSLIAFSQESVFLDAPLEGSISNWMSGIFDRIPDEEKQYLARMPFVIPQQRIGNIARIDSATDWMNYYRESLPCEIPLSYPFISVRDSIDFYFDIQKQRFGFRIGDSWLAYQFLPTFGKSCIDVSPSGDIYFGTTSSGKNCCGEGAQGLCVIRRSGLVERLFIPPLQEYDRRYAAWNTCIPDIQILYCSSDGIVWAGMLKGIIRLDFERDEWRIYNGENSPVTEEVFCISEAPNLGLLRFACSVGSDLSGPYPVYKGYRILQYQEGRWKIEEDHPGLSVVYGESTRFLRGKDGAIWYASRKGVWKSSVGKTEMVCELPDDLAPTMFCWIALVDSLSRIWLVAKDPNEELNVRLYLRTSNRWLDISASVFGPDQSKEYFPYNIDEDRCGRIWIVRSPDLSVLGKKARMEFDVRQARKAFQTGRAAESESLLQQLLQVQPQNPVAHELLANVYQIKGEHEDLVRALEHLSYALEYYWDDADIESVNEKIRNLIEEIQGEG